MADLALTVGQIAPIFPEKADIVDYIAGAPITPGQAVYLDANGAVQPALAGAGTAQFRGIALNVAAIGQAVSVLKQGHVAGFTIPPALAYDAEVYLDAVNAGVLDDAPAALVVNCGRVVPMSDNARTKVLYIEADYLRTWV